MKVRDIVKLIEEDGWYHVKTKSSHRQFKHPTKSGRVTVSGHSSDYVPRGTLLSIIKQAQIPRRQ